MANQEQLRILKRGVNAWNEWRDKNPGVQIDLNSAKLNSAKLNSAKLNSAKLNSAKLNSAKLNSADLRNADLSGAYLYGVDLIRTIALRTNFKGATLTGACIQDWNINNETNFENITCKYIYLKKVKKERRPASGNFAPGDFAKLVEQSIETVDLIFSEGIDWKAFLGSFNDLRVEYADQNVSIKAIEHSPDGAFVIRLNVLTDAKGAEIESYAKQSYETKLKVLEAQYRAELQAKDTEINIYKQQSADMLEIVKLQASRPITVA